MSSEDATYGYDDQSQDLREMNNRTYHNLGVTPKTENPIGKINTVEDYPHHIAQSNQCAAFHYNDGDRFEWRVA